MSEHAWFDSMLVVKHEDSVTFANNIGATELDVEDVKSLHNWLAEWLEGK